MIPTTAVATFGYHDVTDQPGTAGFQRPAALPFKLRVATFARHLDAIAGASAHPSLVTEVDLAAPGRHLLLTFDDGGKSAVWVGDELCRRGWRGHFFIITNRIGERTFLDAAEIRHLRECGHVIGSHSHTHPSVFREQTGTQMIAQWRTSCERLADLLGEPCSMASVPGGDLSPKVVESACAAGLRYLFTSEPTLVPQQVDDCWVLGRFSPKADTAVDRVSELAQFRAWHWVLLTRRLKVLVRTMLPGTYRAYVRRRTRESPAA